MWSSRSFNQHWVDTETYVCRSCDCLRRMESVPSASVILTSSSDLIGLTSSSTFSREASDLPTNASAEAPRTAPSNGLVSLLFGVLPGPPGKPFLVLWNRIPHRTCRNLTGGSAVHLALNLLVLLGAAKAEQRRLAASPPSWVWPIGALPISGPSAHNERVKLMIFLAGGRIFEKRFREDVR